MRNLIKQLQQTCYSLTDLTPGKLSKTEGNR